MIIVADTSALFAAFDESQPEHCDALTVVENEILAVSPLVLAELDYLVRRDLGFPVACQTIDQLADRMAVGQCTLTELRHVDLVAAQEVRAKYEDLRLDLADAVGVVLADRYHTDRIFTLDQRDYRAITPLTPRFRAFRILPAEGRMPEQLRGAGASGVTVDEARAREAEIAEVCGRLWVGVANADPTTKKVVRALSDRVLQDAEDAVDVASTDAALAEMAAGTSTIPAEDVWAELGADGGSSPG